MRLKTLSMLLPVIILTGLLANCASFSPNAKTITIAVVEQQPGEKGRPEPQSIYAGVLLATRQIEDRTGVRINIEPYDDNNDADLAVETANRIANSNVTAVVGHSATETSKAAAGIYEKNSIPVINIVPASETMTQGYLHQFNITYTTETEGAYLANYVVKVLDRNKGEDDKSRFKATIIHTNDEYGTALQRQFSNTFEGLGGEITHLETIDPRQPVDVRLEQIVSTIIAADPDTKHPGTIFIATDDKTAADLVILMKRKGVSYPVIGASNLSSPVFIEKISEQSEEETLPGYFTDGILTTRALIFDSANRYASQFLQEYQREFKTSNPGDMVVNGYEAAMTLLAALENIPAGEKPTRDTLHTVLLKMDRPENGAQGIVSPIYFEPSRNTPRAPRFGTYQNGEVVSANTQFEPIDSPSVIKDLADQVDKGRIMTLNGNYVYVSNVVYAGMDLLGIDEIDIKTSTYKMDFYLWFRYLPHEQDPEFIPDEFVFTNLESADNDPVLIREESNSDGTVLKTYRVSGVFKNQFHFYDYPFDRQELVIEFRNQDATTTFIQYVVDRVGMRYETEDTLLDNFKSNGAFDSIFGWQEQGAHVDQDIFPTFSTFGSPQNFDRTVSTNYSLIQMEVDIQRDSLQYIIKSLLPLFITLVLAYITFFLPLGHSERLAVGSTALLTTAFFHLSLADALPEIGYTVAMEYFFYASYLMSAMIVFMETLSIRMEKKGEDAKKKADKQLILDNRERLNRVGRYAFPAILALAVVAEFFIYNGTLSLSPRGEADQSHLVNQIVKAGLSDQATKVPTEIPVAEESLVKLSLSTWRPEDTKQIQVLLDRFEEYAKTKNRNIAVEYVPVMSVNYDSILEIQLNQGKGPDLFYVRPFSVDGNIAKYLTPLNDLPIDENYAPTKSVAWQNGTGTYFAVPFVGVAQGVYYNKNLFEKYGIEEPETWQEFVNNLSVIREKDPAVVPIANVLNPSEDSEMFMSVAANFLGGPAGRGQFMKRDGTALCFDNLKVVNTYQAVTNLFPYLPKNAGEINSQKAKEIFFQGKAVMMFGGSWDLKKVGEEAADFEWGVFAVPAPSQRKTYVIFQPDIAIGMNNTTKHPAEARMFLEWLMTEEAVKLAGENLPGFYPLRNVDFSAGQNDEPFLKLLHQYETDIRWMYAEINNESPGAAGVVRTSLFDMFSSGLTPREAAQRLQAGLGEWYEPAQTCK